MTTDNCRQAPALYPLSRAAWKAHLGIARFFSSTIFLNRWMVLASRLFRTEFGPARMTGCGLATRIEQAYVGPAGTRCPATRHCRLTSVILSRCVYREGFSRNAFALHVIPTLTLLCAWSYDWAVHANTELPNRPTEQCIRSIQAWYEM
jgi:hypothetical protein